MATFLPPAIPKLTYADLDVVPKEREGDRQELFDGELVVTASPVPAHQMEASNLTIRVGGHVLAGDLGRLSTAPIDVRFAPGAGAVPDLVFVRREQLGSAAAEAIRGAPDLIVGVLSPSTRRRDLGRKTAISERFKVPECWIASPKAQSVTVFVLGDGGYEERPQAGDTPRSSVLPDLVL